MTAAKFVFISALGCMRMQVIRAKEADQKRKHMELYGDDWGITLRTAGKDAETFTFYAQPVGSNNIWWDTLQSQLSS